MRLAVAVIATIGLVGFRGEDTFSLVPKRVKDDVITYDFKMTAKTSDSEFKISGKSKIKVLKVEEDGSYELEESNYDNKVVFDGNESEVPPGQPKNQKYDKHGKRIYTDEEKSDPSQKISQALGDVIDYIPEHDVKMGESWTRESEFGTVKSTLSGREKLGDIDCLKITIQATLSKKETSGTASATFWVRAVDFSIEKGSSKVEDAVMFSGAPPSSFQTELHRIAD